MSDKLNDVSVLARRLMAAHGLGNWAFRFNRARRRAGVCFHPGVGRSGRIELSSHYCRLNGEDEIRDTILHEIAHALVGHGHGHDFVWKQKCEEIGCKPVRCYDKSVVVMPPGKWRAECPKCGKLFDRHRRPNPAKYWYCTKCGQEAELRWSSD